MTLYLLHNPRFILFKPRTILISGFIFLLSFFCCPSSAFAVCASPAGNEADMIYNGTSHVMQFCDGAAWRAMGNVPGYGVSNKVFITSTTTWETSLPPAASRARTLSARTLPPQPAFPAPIKPGSPSPPASTIRRPPSRTQRSPTWIRMATSLRTTGPA